MDWLKITNLKVDASKQVKVLNKVDLSLKAEQNSSKDASID